MAQSTVLPTFRFMALPAKLRDAVYEEAYICKERYIVVMRRGPVSRRRTRSTHSAEADGDRTRSA